MQQTSTNPDFNSPEVIANPFPVLAEMRARDGIEWNDSLKGWCLTRHDNICAAFTDKRLSAARIQPFLEGQSGIGQDILDELGAVFLLWLPFLDPPNHTRLRKLLTTGFTGRAIAKLPEQIAKISKGIIADWPSCGTLDVIADFASPLPGIVIADILGVPRVDVGRLKRWSDDIAGFILASRLQENKYRIAARATAEMRDYFDALIERRKQNPGCAIIDELIAAHEGDDHLSRAELLSSCVLLLFAGHETTTQMFGNGALALMRHPDQLSDFLAGSADAKLVANTVEEVLRFDGPTVATVRVARETMTIGAVTIKAGNRLHLFIGAANRDPAIFADPDRFDIRRENARKQINFGYGIHACLGARLARMEGAVAFPQLMRALHGAVLPETPPQWSDSLIVRGLKSLKVTR